MNPTEFICGLMRRNNQDLGFILTPAHLQHWIKQGLYILQTNRLGSPVGYLLHANVNAKRTMYVHQADLEISGPNRDSAHDVVTTLLERAQKQNADDVLLPSSSNLHAVDFWISCAFVPTAIAPGGPTRQRTIIHFRKKLRSHQEELDGETLPNSRRPNV